MQLIAGSFTRPELYCSRDGDSVFSAHSIINEGVDQYESPRRLRCYNNHGLGVKQTLNTETIILVTKD